MGNVIQGAVKILAAPRYAGIFILATALLMIVYALTSNIFVVGTLELNPLGIEPVTIALLALLAVGGGLLVTAWLYQRKISAKTCVTGVAGGSLGLFSSACSVCPPILAFLIGGNAVFALSKWSTIFSAIAVVLVYYGVFKTLEVV